MYYNFLTLLTYKPSPKSSFTKSILNSPKNYPSSSEIAKESKNFSFFLS